MVYFYNFFFFLLILSIVCYRSSPFASLPHHHVHKRRIRVYYLLPRVLSQQPGPSDAPLPAHLLCSLPGETLQAGRHHPHRLLPAVSLDHLHSGLSDPTWISVGQHWDLGPDPRAETEQQKFTRGGFRRHPHSAHQQNTGNLQKVWFHVYIPENVQLWAASWSRDGELLTV